MKRIKGQSSKFKIGFTTGTAAALASKACVIMLQNKKIVKNINILTPAGIVIETKIFDHEINDQYALCSVIKDAGDDPDITNGIKIFCRATKNNTSEIKIIGGKGIGTVTKKGLSVSVGEKAINPVPRQMINDAIRSVDKKNGYDIEIYIPKGEYIAKKTFNEKLGIVGGISVIGTTGIVKPMFQEAIIETLYLELKILREEKDQVVLTFGNYGENFAVNTLGIDKKQIVNMSNYCGNMLLKSNELGFKKITLVGHIGKIVKLAGRIFNTHSSISDARMEILSSHYGFYSGNIKIMKKIFTSNTTEEACDYINDKAFFNYFAGVVKQRCLEYMKTYQNKLDIIIFSQEKGLLGASK